MPSPSRIRAAAKDGVTEVRALMQHEMENGRRKDEAGNIVAAWFIAEVRVLHAGRVVLDAQFGTSVAKNPYLVFRFRGGKAGDKLVLSWKDNRGEERTDEVEIS